MKSKIDIKSGALLGAVIMFSVAAATTPEGRPVWNYNIITGRMKQTHLHPSLPQQLEQAAAEGWEVVAATSDDGFPMLILRRPK